MEVTAAAPLLQTSRGTASFVVEQKKMGGVTAGRKKLRSPDRAVTGRESTAWESVAAHQWQPAAHQRVTIYDGISVLQPEPGQVAFYPIVDAIEEFRVEINSPSAEYGRSNGG